MSDHEIVWRHDRDSVTQELVCNLPDTADCHQIPDCACEVYSGLQYDEQGAYHEVIRYTEDDTEVEEKHRHHPSNQCNLAEWLNADSGLIPESARSQTTFEIGRTPVTIGWSGDYYEWSKA